MASAIVSSQNGELIAGLPVKRLLENVAVRRHDADFPIRVPVEEYPGLGRDAVQNHGAVSGDHDLKLLPQGDALQLQHGLLLRIRVQSGFHLVDEHESSPQAGDVLGDAEDGAFPGGHVKLGVATPRP